MYVPLRRMRHIRHLGIKGSYLPFNPCTAEVFVSIFLSFEAGIADAISSFKWMKNNIIYEKSHLPNRIIWLTEHLPQDMLQILVCIFSKHETFV